MAKTLLEALKEAQAKAEKQAQAVPQLGTTQALQQQVQAQTGRVAERQVALSSQQEQAQIAAASAQEKARSYGTRIMQEQIGQAQQSQQTQQKQAEKDLRNKQIDMQLEMQMKTSEMLDNLLAKRNELSINRLKSNTEMMGQMMRITNAEYVDSLNAAAMRARLDNDARFAEELQVTMFQDSLDILNSDLQMQSALRADEREFKDYLSGLQIDEATLSAIIESQAKSLGQMISGGEQVLQGGIKAWDSTERSGQDTARDNSAYLNSRASPEDEITELDPSARTGIIEEDLP
jgi:hypothetical protein